MVESAKKVAEIVRTNPYVDTFFVSTGGNQSMNTARLNVQLVPRRQRPLSAAQIAQQIRPQLQRFPGFQAFTSLPPAIQIGGRQANSSYTLTVESADTANLYQWAQKLEQQIATMREVQDVSDDMEMKSPRVDLVVDRDQAAAVGLTANDIEGALYNGLGPQWSSTIYGNKSQYKVLLELDPRDQQHVDSLSLINFKTSTGGLVPLDSVLKVRETVGPQTVNHAGQLPAVTISFGLRPGVALGAAVDRIQQVASSLLPPTVTNEFQG
jgi:HAE1 family hydrophobic/amphiphilic exporter-1